MAWPRESLDQAKNDIRSHSRRVLREVWRTTEGLLRTTALVTTGHGPVLREVCRTTEGLLRTTGDYWPRSVTQGGMEDY